MPNFKELSKAKIQESRNLVISKLSEEDKFTLAQQLIVNEGNKNTTIFMKGAIHIDGTQSLYDLRNALNEAIEKIEESKNN